MVHQHLKRIFDKIALHSGRKLVDTVFFAHDELASATMRTAPSRAIAARRTVPERARSGRLTANEVMQRACDRRR
jgi:hypothetical protein